jgi:restriction endonuclease Mrr
MCGWWAASEKRIVYDFEYDTESEQSSGLAGILLNLDLSDQSLPISEIRSYLVARYQSRFDIDPHLMEEVVASVYKDLGYSAEAVGRTGDGGIDVILTGPKSVRTGVQVKRYQNSIKVEQIRAFLGALVLKGYTKGIFITTSSFQRGVFEATQIAEARGFAIELVDAPRFLAALRIAQRERYNSVDDSTAPFADWLRK